MSDKLLSKPEFLKRARIDDKKLQYFIDHEILEANKIYTEDELDLLKEFRKSHPLELNEVSKRFKLNIEQIEKFKELGLIEGTQYFTPADLDIFSSWQKLKRLGYGDDACLKVLNEVGVPKDDNLFENETLIQLKELSESLGIPERTIKFYEKGNLIQKPRIYKNKRFYDKKILDNLILIRDMQQIGYKLSSIAEFLNKIRTDKNKSEIIDSMKQEIIEKIKTAKNIIKRMETI